MGLMADEIASQPDVIEANAGHWQKQAEAIRSRCRDRRTLVLVGRGSSANAGAFTTYLHGLATGRHAVQLRPWLTVQDLPQADWSDAWVLAYSVSGQSTDVSHAARWLKDRGAYVIGVTNSTDASCHLGRASHELFQLDAGPERAVPATKTFGAQLFAAAALCGFPIEDAAKDTARRMRELLASDAWEQLGRFLSGAELVWWIARGPARAAALDAALKTMESAALPGVGWSAAEVLHGPVGSASPAHRAVVFVDQHEPASSLDAAGAAFVARGTPMLRVGAPGEGHTLSIPLPAERWARAAVFGLLSQRTALHMATLRGLDPDSPVGLRKVTLT